MYVRCCNSHVCGSRPSVSLASNSLPSKTKLKASSPNSLIHWNWNSRSTEVSSSFAVWESLFDDIPTHLLTRRSITISKTRQLSYGNHFPLTIIVQIRNDFGFDGLVQFLIVLFYHCSFGNVEQLTTTYTYTVIVEGKFNWAALECKYRKSKQVWNRDAICLGTQLWFEDYFILHTFPTIAWTTCRSKFPTAQIQEFVHWARAPFGLPLDSSRFITLFVPHCLKNVRRAVVNTRVLTNQLVQVQRKRRWRQ